MGPIFALFGKGRARLLRAGGMVLCLLIALISAAAPAHAQSQQSIDVRMAIFGDLSITKTEDLDFGKILAPAAGTVVMTPTPNPSCIVTGGVTHVGACQPAEFGGAGETNRIVRIKKPSGQKITLTGPGTDMTVTNLVIDASPDLQEINVTPGFSRYRIVSSTGIFTFRFGGTLNVAANQAPGVYTGTFNITIQYN